MFLQTKKGHWFNQDPLVAVSKPNQQSGNKKPASK